MTCRRTEKGGPFAGHARLPAADTLELDLILNKWGAFGDSFIEAASRAVKLLCLPVDFGYSFRFRRLHDRGDEPSSDALPARRWNDK